MNPELNERLWQCQRGEVPKGYAIGKEKVIYPQDWAANKIGECLRMVERPAHLEDEQQYELVTVRRAFGGVDSRGIFQGKNIKVKDYYRVKKGDFLISKRQIAHGACGVVPEKLNNAVVSNEYNVFEVVHNISADFFSLLMHVPRYKHLFYLMSDGVHIEKLLFKTQDWLQRRVAMPGVEEQRKIATILSTQNRVIELKEKLLEQKKLQKKYLMQQLLNKHFYKSYNIEALNSFCEFLGGGTPDTKNEKFWHGKIPWISSSDVQENSIFSLKIERFITEDAVDNSATKKCQKGSVLVVNRVGVGKIVIASRELCTSQDFVNIIQSKYDNIYFAYALKKLISEKLSQVQGSAIKGIPAKEIKQYRIAFPSKQEQFLIGQTLSASDREISLLEQSIEFEKQKKCGLMQLLLTGIVRV